MKIGIGHVNQIVPGQKDDVDGGEHGPVQTEAVTNHPLESVAVNRPSHLLFCDHQTESGVVAAVGANQQQETGFAYLESGTVKYGLEFRRPQQAAGPRKTAGRVQSPESDGQALAALGTTTGQNLAAVLGGHAGTEAVDAGALEHAGLESTLHDLCSKKERNPTKSERAAILGRRGGIGNGAVAQVSGRSSAESRRDEARFSRPSLLLIL